MMYQVTIFFNTDRHNYNCFSIPVIPHVGEEVAVVHGNREEEIYRITIISSSCLQMRNSER